MLAPDTDSAGGAPQRAKGLEPGVPVGGRESDAWLSGCRPSSGAEAPFAAPSTGQAESWCGALGSVAGRP